MVKKIQQIYTSTTAGAFEEMLRDALSQVDADGVIKLAIFNLPAMQIAEGNLLLHSVKISISFLVLFLSLSSV